MNAQNNGKTLSCVDCGSLNCKKRSGKYPDFCLTQDVTQKEAAELADFTILTLRIRIAGYGCAGRI